MLFRLNPEYLNVSVPKNPKTVPFPSPITITFPRPAINQQPIINNKSTKSYSKLAQLKNPLTTIIIYNYFPPYRIKHNLYKLSKLI